MRRTCAKFGVVLLAAFGASLVSSGCAENESTLFIVGVAKIEGDCTYTGSASTLFLPRGVFDLGFSGSYQAGLVLGNQMAARGLKARSRTETSRILLEGAEISLVLPGGGLLMDPFSAPGAGFVDVSTGQDPGYGVLSVVVIPGLKDAESAGVALDAGYVMAEIKAFGHTLGGQAVESNVFRFPIDVCVGCLVTFPATELDPVTNECRGTASSDIGAVPCNWGQDSQVVCSSCSANYEVCRVP